MTHTIDIKELRKLLDNVEPVTLLDVRRRADYQANPYTIKGALWRDPEKIGDWVKQLPANQRTVVYCVKGGSVSQSVTDRLRGEGLYTVFLDGGLKNWTESGQPVEAVRYTIRDADIELLRQAGVSEEDIAHSVKVAEKALEIASRISKNLDMELVGRGALFHDLGKAKTHEIEHGRLGAEMGAAFTEIKGATWDSGTDTLEAIRNKETDIETDTQDLQTQVGVDGAGLTNLPWNASWDAEVQSECADALTVYDPPTNAEMEARTLVAANYGTAAGQATIVGYIDTEVQAVLDAVDTEVNAIKAKTDNLPEGIQKNTASANFTFFMADDGDHVSGLTGATVTATRRLDSGSFATCANAPTEVGNGIYTINLDAADLNGDIVTLRFTATGADDTVITIKTEA